MKVLFLLDSLNRGGSQILALDICRNASAHGMEVTLVATGGGHLEEDFKRSGVEFIRLQRKSPVDLRVVRALRKIVRERKIEIIHTQQAVEGVHAYLSTVGTRTKRVLALNGYVPDKKNHRALTFLWPRMDANLFCSAGLEVWFREEAGLNINRNVHVILLGVDDKRLRTNGNSLRSKLGLEADALLFGMVANFYPEPRKDQMTVCKALPALVREFPNAHFVFSGDPALAPDKFDACVAYCRDHGVAPNAHFLGLGNRDDIPGVYDALDVFVLSSIHEGLGLVAIEAMLLGKPCVLSDIGPLMEVANNGEFAVMFKTGDAEALAGKLIELARDPAKRKDLADRSQRWARDEFSIDAYLAKLKQLYQSLLG